MKGNKFLAPIAIIVGVVAIAAAIVVLTTRGNNSSTDKDSSPQTSMSSSNQNSSQQASGQGTNNTNTTTPPAADTVVPDGMTPDAMVKKYYDLILAKDFKGAYEYQPASKKNTDVAGFQSTIEGYGIKAADVGKTTESSDIATVEAKLTTQAFGTFTTTWNFTKKNGKWVADSTQTNLMSK